MSVLRSLNPRTMLRGMSRTAMLAFLFSHRHEILRWGRSLYEQVIHRSGVSPVRATRTAHLLFTIAADHRLRDAKQLRKVTMDGDDVELEVDERWAELPRLIEHVRAVKGVRHVFVNGNPEVAATAVRAAS